MSVAAVGAAVVGVAGSAYAASKSADAAKKARRAAQLQPFAVNTPFGNASIERGRLEVQDSPGQSLAPGFEQNAQMFQDAVGQEGVSQGLGLDPRAVMQQALSEGQGTADAFGALGMGFGGAAAQALGGVQNFDAGAFAQEHLAGLNALARPGEEGAANSLANRLFSQGRMGGGDTRAGRAFGELSQSQDRAAFQRAIMSQQAAQQELTSRIGQAGQLSQFGLGATQGGLQAQGMDMQNFLAAIQGGIGADQAGLARSQQLQGLSIQGTQGIQEAFAPSRSAIQALLGGSEIQQGGSATAAQAIMQGGTAQANLIGNATAGLTTGLMNFASSRNQQPSTT